MGFEALLGNERLRQNISRSIQRGHISHFYLISGPKGSGKHTLARLLAAAIHCTGGGKRRNDGRRVQGKRDSGEMLEVLLPCQRKGADDGGD